MTTEDETGDRSTTRTAPPVNIPAGIDELSRLCDAVGRRIRIMEVCGTHTVSFFRSGLRSLLPANLHLLSGPGCPVCVTPQRHIDAALDLAARPEVIIATYGDMLRVPGKRGSLERLRAAGASIHVVSSARSALDLACEHPRREVVFLGVGFETTAPATAAVVVEAEARAIANFSVLMSHKRVIPAMRALLESGHVPLDGFLCPGHVSVIIGARAFEPLACEFRKPCVVAGFEPEQMLTGLLHLARQVIDRRPRLENVYAAAVSDFGNPVAQALLERVFTVSDAPWRALGEIPAGGYELASPYSRFDALKRFNLTPRPDCDHPACRCGEVICGRIDPHECSLFDHGCDPLHPLGPCMVSSEGTCAAWHRFRRRRTAVSGAPIACNTGGGGP